MESRVDKLRLPGFPAELMDNKKSLTPRNSPGKKNQYKNNMLVHKLQKWESSD